MLLMLKITKNYKSTFEKPHRDIVTIKLGARTTVRTPSPQVF